MAVSYPDIISEYTDSSDRFETGGLQYAGYFEPAKVAPEQVANLFLFLQNTLNTDPGARRLGEFAIGTNEDIQRFTGAILFDEKIGGTVHMALGQGYPQSGSTNTSAIHWDMICDMRDGSEIWVDGELFYHNGEFLKG